MVNPQELQFCQIERQWKKYDEATNEWLDIIQPGLPNRRHCLSLAVVSFLPNPAEPVEVFIKDGNSIIFKCITVGTLMLPFFPALVGGYGNSIVLTVAPAGADITAIGAIVGYTIPSL